MARKLYVGNFPYDTTDQDLRSLFAGSGDVESVNVVTDQATGRGRGFAFVEMATDEAAQAAIRDLNNHDLGGRALTVNEARPKVTSGGGGGGYGGGGGGSRRRSEPRW
jgi:RNA recognition motif-containing protein